MAEITRRGGPSQAGVEAQAYWGAVASVTLVLASMLDVCTKILSYFNYARYGRSSGFLLSRGRLLSNLQQ